MIVLKSIRELYVMMQNFSLRVSTIIDHAARYHPNRPVIGRSVEGPIVESNWLEVQREAKQVAAGLTALGVKKGDVIGVMAWNTVRHLSVWYGVPGAGAVNHTLDSTQPLSSEGGAKSSAPNGKLFPQAECGPPVKSHMLLGTKGRPSSGCCKLAGMRSISMAKVKPFRAHGRFECFFPV
jgi:hypothetical protein